MRGKCVIERASKYSHAKRGYFAFVGDYPKMTHKYFKSKVKAKYFCNKINKKR